MKEKCKQSCLLEKKELHKEGRELPSRVRLREGPVGVRITLGQLIMYVSKKPSPLENLWCCFAGCGTVV